MSISDLREVSKEELDSFDDINGEREHLDETKKEALSKQNLRISSEDKAGTSLNDRVPMSEMNDESYNIPAPSSMNAVTAQDPYSPKNDSLGLSQTQVLQQSSNADNQVLAFSNTMQSGHEFSARPQYNQVQGQGGSTIRKTSIKSPDFKQTTDQD